MVTPLLVERFRSALPPRAQTEINSVTEAPKKLALVFDDIFTTFTESLQDSLMCRKYNIAFMYKRYISEVTGINRSSEEC